MSKCRAYFKNPDGYGLEYEFEGNFPQSEVIANKWIEKHNGLTGMDYKLEKIKYGTEQWPLDIQIAKSSNEKYLTIAIGKNTAVIEIDSLLGFLDSEHECYTFENLITELNEE